MNDCTNADRAAWALESLSVFVRNTGVDTAKEAISALVTNLLHLARGRQFDTLQLIDQAHDMMLVEFAEDDEGAMNMVQNAFAKLLCDDDA